ncbi:MAG: ABC transporter ATP-binding protein [Lachnospiraceae bacterium]|nr:ABC transporter ATP-binding protein [Lachnospiraceae bacterium]
MARNTYGVDEKLETPFSFEHLKRASVYIVKYKNKMLLALLISAIASATGLLAPLLTQTALDESIPNKDVRQLITLAIFLAGTYVISIILATVRSKIMTVVGQDIIYDIRKDLFAHLQKLPFQYYDDRPHGKILIRVVNYVNSVSNMLSGGIINIILEFLNMFFILIFMLMVDVGLTFVVLSGMIPFAIVIGIIKKRQRRAWQDQSNKSSNLNAYLQENIVGAKVTQIFVREEENATIFDGLAEKLRKAWMKAVNYNNLLGPSVDSIAIIVRGAIFAVGLLLLGPTAISVGTIVAMTSYAARFWQPIMNIANLFNDFINNIAYLERIFETLDEPVTIDDKEGAEDIGDIKGKVEFENVTFAYEKDKTVLENVSFTVNPGERIALVGPTGAGQSTIVSLISRFYNVNEGRILVDGKDISEVTLKSLRSQMGIMLQDSFIFSGTIADNIRYGKLDATQKEIEAAGRTVCADRFIRKTTDGYMTEVKERGALLSQGQKQLISFARTLLSDPRILILDEATSSIDVQTEKDLQEGLNELLKGRTSFIIAHRLSTIRNCDRIMYINNKGITECGSHDELMAKKGDYYHLYTAQMKEVS